MHLATYFWFLMHLATCVESVAGSESFSNQNLHFFEKYLNSFYNMIVIFSTVGYGDKERQMGVENLLILIVELFAGVSLFYPSITSKTVYLFRLAEKNHQQILKEVEETEDWLINLERLTMKSGLYLHTDEINKRFINLNRGLAKIDLKPALKSWHLTALPPSLKQAVLKKLQTGIVNGFGYFFRFFSEEFSDELKKFLRPKLYPKNYLIQDGINKKWKGIFFILQGFVTITQFMATKRPTKLGIIPQFSYFGDECVLEKDQSSNGQTQNTHWAYVAKGTHGVVILFLPFEKLQELFYKFPGDFIRFREISLIRLERLQSYCIENDQKGVSRFQEKGLKRSSKRRVLFSVGDAEQSRKSILHARDQDSVASLFQQMTKKTEKKPQSQRNSASIQSIQLEETRPQEGIFQRPAHLMLDSHYVTNNPSEESQKGFDSNIFDSAGTHEERDHFDTRQISQKSKEPSEKAKKRPKERLNHSKFIQVDSYCPGLERDSLKFFVPSLASRLASLVLVFDSLTNDLTEEVEAIQYIVFKKKMECLELFIK